MMRVVIVCFFICLLFTSCTTLLFPRHLGKIQLIKAETLKKSDSFLVLPYAYVYGFHSNVFVSRQRFVVSRIETDTTGTSAPTPESKGYNKNSEMIQYEKKWSDIVTSKLNLHFKSNSHLQRESKEWYGQYQFKYKIGFSNVKSVMADYNDLQMAHIAWLIKDGYIDSAKKKLPAALHALSYKNPLIIIANYSYFHETEFQANYSTGSTGIRFDPVSMIVIVKNGEFIYYRNAQAAKGYRNDKYVTKVLSKLTEHLFDKLE